MINGMGHTSYDFQHHILDKEDEHGHGRIDGYANANSA